MNTIELTIPANWLEELSLEQDDLRQALMLGLTQLRQQRTARDASTRVVQVLLSTGRVRHLSTAPMEKEGVDTSRQAPPTLPGLPVSEILIGQRRGEL